MKSQLILLALLLTARSASTADSALSPVASTPSSTSAPARFLANEFVKVFESPDPETVFCYSPGLARCSSGRLIATFDLGGPGVQRLPGPKAEHGDFGLPSQGKVYTSDDRGRTWQFRIDFPFRHARPFVAGSSVYVLGHAGDLQIIRSTDEGKTWSKPAASSTGEEWHQAPCNVHFAHGSVYLVMEKRKTFAVNGWPVSELAPVLMRAKTTDDLTRRESWTFASELSFREALSRAELDYFGVPFFNTAPTEQMEIAPHRSMSPIGWLEANVVQFLDPNHYWFDPNGKTFHLWLRAHTGATGYAAVAKVTENADGSMTTQLETAPSGKRMLFVPCPGGQMKFHILYDEVAKLYWLLSTQATDSLARAEKLPSDRYGLPNNERRRLQLHFSKNCIDWCFAGMVAVGKSAKESRHYASMVIDGEDLQILSRSGDERAASAHNGNLISFHTVKNFRSLVY